MDYQSEYYKIHTSFHGEDALRKFCEISTVLSNYRPQKIVDLGCGGGYVSRLIYKKFKPVMMIALDVSEEAIKHAKDQDNNGRIEYVVGDALKFRTNKVDLVIINDLIEHLSQPSLLLKNIKEYSSLIIIRVPLEKTFVNTIFRKLNIKNEYARLRKKYGHIYPFTEKEITSLLNNSGWKIEYKKIFPIPKRSYLPFEIIRLSVYPLYYIFPSVAALLNGGFLVAKAKAEIKKN